MVEKKCNIIHLCSGLKVPYYGQCIKRGPHQILKALEMEMQKIPFRIHI
jgi:hypothetical protein